MSGICFKIFKKEKEKQAEGRVQKGTRWAQIGVMKITVEANVGDTGVHSPILSTFCMFENSHNRKVSKEKKYAYCVYQLGLEDMLPDRQKETAIDMDS